MMKTIGLIGGMSWESSKVYYELLNQRVNQLLGGHHSCPCLMYSVEFAEIERLQHEDRWDELDFLMAQAAKRLEAGGADLVILCTNTMHVASKAIESAVKIPFLHIAQATAEAIISSDMTRVGLLGTRFTMEKDFYRDILEKEYQLEVITPNATERERIHQIIFDELVKGKVNPGSKAKLIEIISNLKTNGAEGIILGCTEIPMLIAAEELDIPAFDTTSIHAQKAVSWALGSD